MKNATSPILNQESDQASDQVSDKISGQRIESMPFTWVVTCSPGLEDILKEEIKSLDWNLEPKISLGALTYEAPIAFAFDVCFRSQIASRVLYQLRIFSAKSKEMLYDQVRRIDWQKIFYPPGSDVLDFAVFVHGQSEAFAMNFAALKIKDAICDEIRKAGFDRPPVQRQEPQIRIEALFTSAAKCELAMDFSGAPLHRRGYRVSHVEAPLRENRAAALVKFSGWDSNSPLIDPFCGSGTLLIEAAHFASSRGPGINRALPSFPLRHLFSDFESSFTKAKNNAEEKIQKLRADISGFDLSPDAVTQAKKQIEKAGFPQIKIGLGDARKLPPLKPGTLIICHPPYGLRTSDPKSAENLISGLSHQLKHSGFEGKLALVVPKGPLEKAPGLRPSKKCEIKDGSLTLKFLVFDLYAGSKGSKRG